MVGPLVGLAEGGLFGFRTKLGGGIGQDDAGRRRATASNKRRYSPATVGQLTSVPKLALYADIAAPTPGSMMIFVNAAAIAAESFCGTSIPPRPSPRSSSAWGNLVATTGTPAASASVSTPEVTCSWES